MKKRQEFIQQISTLSYRFVENKRYEFIKTTCRNLKKKKICIL